ncbi:cytochrome P450 [Streptomyces sp. FXJ1.4098]|nr:cytochrome P450 [Streptomyces sp. FXJ1.4098]
MRTAGVGRGRLWGRHLGRRRPRRSDVRTGAAGGAFAAHGRRRHHRARSGGLSVRLRHPPDEWQRLRERPELARAAFDEAVRWQSPVQTFFRTATTDVTVAGTVVPADTKILMFLGAANRDPARWHDPDRFDLTRDPSGHVGFGMGLHQCIGQHVARLEAEALLTALARRVERFELAGTPHRHPNNTLRSWASLPLRVRPAV